MTEIAFLLYEDMTALDADADTRRRATEHMVPGGDKVEVTR
jgi:hypothetical protein